MFKRDVDNQSEGGERDGDIGFARNKFDFLYNTTSRLFVLVASKSTSGHLMQRLNVQ